MLKLSIVIPSLNQEAPIGRAIQQFWSPQTSARTEVLVVDAGSSDGTPAVARLLADRLVTPPCDPENWQSEARNHGATAAAGDVLLFVQPETRMRDTVEQILGRLEELFQDGRQLICAVPAGETGEASAGWIAVQRSAFLAAGGFDPKLNGSAERDLLERLADEGRVERLDDLQFEVVVPAPEAELAEVAA